MNRKQKIIVSITGIILVSLILIGLTYAYFLTKITGNTNSKSISVTTANLAVVYEDNSAEILGKDLILEPDSEKEIGTKNFTVTNKGNATTSYVVLIEDTKITNATDGTTTTFESNDFRYTLTCTKKDGTACVGVSSQSVFPINGGIIVSNNIDVGDVQTYVLKLWYIDTGKNQTNDMNKRLEAKINIANDDNNYNPYSANEDSLAYQILNNGALVQDNTSNKLVTDKKIKNNPNLNEVANGTSYNGSFFTNDGLFKTPDNYSYETGIDSYYYRGSVKNNYLNFNGMCWRIVRIEGDGSVKIVLASDLGECNAENSLGESSAFIKSNVTDGDNTDYNGYFLLFAVGNHNESRATGISDNLNAFLRGDSYGWGYQTTGNYLTIRTNQSFTDKISSLKSSKQCVSDDSIKYDSSGNVISDTTGLSKWYYDKYLKLYNKLGKGVEASLVCDVYSKDFGYGDNFAYAYVTLLTADEVVFAGAKAKVPSSNYYLAENANGNWWLATHSKHDNDYELVSSAGNEFSFIVGGDGSLYNYGYKNPNKIRPVMILKSGIRSIYGDGTITNPYSVS